MEEELGIAGVAASVLVLIDAERDITIERLAKLLSVAQSSLTRAIQQLDALGLVEKAPGKDRRTLILRLTRDGKRKLARMLRLRAAILEAAIGVLPAGHQRAFAEGLGAALSGILQTPDDRFRICRLCDESSCGGYKDCPVEQGAARLRGEDAASPGRP